VALTSQPLPFWRKHVFLSRQSTVDRRQCCGEVNVSECRY